MRKQGAALAAALGIGLLALAGVSGAQEEVQSTDPRSAGGGEEWLPALTVGSQENAPPADEADYRIDVAETPTNQEYARGELLVKYKDKESKGKADKKGGKAKTVTDTLDVVSFDEVKKIKENGKSLRALEAKEKELEAQPGVEYAELNSVYHADWEPNDPWIAPNSRQYYFRAMSPITGWDYPYSRGVATSGTPVRIAVLGSGFDASHAELCRRFVASTNACDGKVAAQHDFVFDEGAAHDDSNGHETHVASIAAALTNNAYGMAGASPQGKLLVAKTAHNGTGTAGEFIQGINWARNNGAKVINISYSSTVYNQTYKAAIDAAYDAGVTVVASSGNYYSCCEGNFGVKYPAAYPKVIAVGGSDGAARWSNANYGPELDVVAPAETVWGAIPTYSTSDGNIPFAGRNGTSESAPMVAGLVADIISTSNTPPTQGEIRRALFENADDLSAAGFDNQTGHGRVDFYRTLRAAQAY